MSSSGIHVKVWFAPRPERGRPARPFAETRAGETPALRAGEAIFSGFCLTLKRLFDTVVLNNGLFDPSENLSDDYS
jgi:hypothetical protein